MENKSNKNRPLFTILWIAVLIVPLLLNGFISFTDWIQFGIVTYMLYEFDVIEGDIGATLFIIFLLAMVFSGSSDPNEIMEYREYEPHF